MAQARSRVQAWQLRAATRRQHRSLAWLQQPDVRRTALSVRFEARRWSPHPTQAGPLFASRPGLPKLNVVSAPTFTYRPAVLRLPAFLRSTYVAALLAVALLSYAGVKSTVMQVAMATAVADCGMPAKSMAGMAKTAHQVEKSTKGEACPFCADAAQAPLIAPTTPLHAPTAVVFVQTPPTLPLGARAPPAFAPRARGPPSVLLTA